MHVNRMQKCFAEGIPHEESIYVEDKQYRPLFPRGREHHLEETVEEERIETKLDKYGVMQEHHSIH